ATDRERTGAIPPAVRARWLDRREWVRAAARAGRVGARPGGCQDRRGTAHLPRLRRRPRVAGAFERTTGGEGIPARPAAPPGGGGGELVLPTACGAVVAPARGPRDQPGHRTRGPVRRRAKRWSVQSGGVRGLRTPA